ncbi:hypothetical protein N8987_03590, partial [Crocinitomix sp.]|nr:hypothetical protein [Crocinitomix sp.]
PLIELRKKLLAIPKSALSNLRDQKVALLDDAIINCLGLYIDITATDYAFAPNESISLSYNLVNRSPLSVQVNGIKGKEILIDLNQNENIEETIEIRNTAGISNPYWLNEPFTTLFKVKNKANLGKAESDPTFSEEVDLLIEGEAITIKLPVIYKWRDPSYGERQRTIISSPNFSVNFDQTSVILKPGQEKTLKLKIHGFAENLNDEIQIKAPEGWEVSPSAIMVKTTAKHEEIWAEIKLKSSENSKRGQLILTDQMGNALKTFTEISYDHIPTQVIFRPAELTCIPLTANIKPGKIAYIKGAGDAVPQAIEQLGFELDMFEVSDLSTIQLHQYQSVVLGIRIYNIYPELHNFDSKLFDYVKNGGNLVMQYNTASRNPSGEEFGPSTFELSRNRVTEEDSKVTFLAPKHPIMNVPNKITQSDFDNWVQERGLYFASNYGSEYTPLFAWNDTGESSQEGGLIVTKHGKGQFVYTGISFFRELPNGVEGAYRLFANILSY